MLEKSPTLVDSLKVRDFVRDTFAISTDKGVAKFLVDVLPTIDKDVVYARAYDHLAEEGA